MTTRGRRHQLLQNDKPTMLNWFMVAVEIQQGVNIDDVTAGIKNGIWHMEGIGPVDVDYMGQLEDIDPVSVIADAEANV